MDVIGILSWACWIGAILSLAVYVYAFVLRPRGHRLLSTMGLFFTFVALTQIPLFLRHGAEGANFANAGFAVVSLLAAAVAQALVAVRGRSQDRRRRSGDADAAAAKDRR
jgi:hypothetical protein